jgi:Domain of unknown function (DUF4405)
MRITFRRILNLLLYLSFCIMVGTGLLMAYRLIPGSRGGQGLEVVGWNRHEWGALHTWTAYVFIVLLAAHLAINWAWLTKVAAKGHDWRLGAGLLAGAVIIGAFLVLPVTQGQDRRAKKHGISFQVSPTSAFIRVSSTSPSCCRTLPQAKLMNLTPIVRNTLNQAPALQSGSDSI